MYNTVNGVKPRFDNGGTEFGIMHRDLGPGYLMFDIDRLSAVVEIGIELRKENEGWLEFRRTQKRIDFVAMFELKKSRTQYSEDALNSHCTNSLARLEIARRLGARLFVVFATEGKQPFTFHEIDTVTGEPAVVGVLDYDQDNRRQCCAEFWRNKLRIERDTW